MENFLSALILLLFLAAAGILLYRLLRAPVQVDAADKIPAARQQGIAALAVLAWAAAVLAVILATAAARGPDMPLLQAWESWFGVNIDAESYLKLARWGYGAAEADFPEQYLMIVFFPLYPALLRPFALLGANLWLCGTLLNVALTAAGAVLFYRVVSRILDEEAARWALAFLLVMPGSFFLVQPQTEALFFFLTFAFLECMQTDRLFFAAGFGLLAALCRAPGVLLAGYVLVDAWMRWRSRRGSGWRWLVPATAPLVGFGSYLALNQAVYGNAWQFTVYQREHWSNGTELFWRSLRTMYGCLQRQEPGIRIFLGAWTVGVLVAEIVLLFFAARRLPVPWLAHGLAYYVIVNGQAWLISAQRYALGLPALTPALAVVCQKRWQRVLVLALLAGLWGVYFAAFLNRCYIY